MHPFYHLNSVTLVAGSCVAPSVCERTCAELAETLFFSGDGTNIDFSMGSDDFSLRCVT